MPRTVDVDAQISQKTLSLWGTADDTLPEELDPRELWWRDRYKQLSHRGYLLRPRYSPQWAPSWKTSNRDWLDSEDGKRLKYGQVIDATRTSDRKPVTLKRFKRGDHQYEADIALYFSSQAFASHPANHCVPVYEVFTLDAEDDTVIMVMPLLRLYNDPVFDTIGEAMECFRQLFEGLQFMHKHRVAHRDCMNRNIMLDPTDLYPESFHPVATNLNKDCSGNAKHFTRTERPPKYYFIDFGISRRYDPSVTDPKEIPIWGGDKEVPEFQNSNEPCDPFATDVFYVGNAIKMDFVLERRGFEFMKPLISSMIQADPDKRPKMDEVVTQFDEVLRRLSRRKLRSRVVDIHEDLFERVVRTTSHWKRRIGFIARGVPAIPSPPS
ncbi:kinase-like domain-containing protein [Boletus edulis BED1]|uniref:Kinase-like domain-containing protein n=1 Tax=Boletus edulis BED1 TaxID=1328754 RepID=A0AAD4GFS8_BOLED|nr:kinase-like domain-containing protein [Boletus edulis BED1]